MGLSSRVSLFRYSVRLDVLIMICVVVGVLLATTFGSCSRFPLAETFGTLGNLGAPKDYSIDPTLKVPSGAWNTARDYPKYDVAINSRKLSPDTQVSEMVSPDESMNFFAKTKFSPQCCGSTNSNSQGCSCMNEKQLAYLNSRGGNRTSGDF